MKRLNTLPNHLTRTFVGVLAIAVVVVLAACFGGDDEESASPITAAAAAVVMEEDAAGFATGEEGASDLYSSGGFDIGVIGRDVIIEVQVLVGTDNIQRTVASIMADVAALGGGVAFSNIDYGVEWAEGGGTGYATLVVKVPPEGIDRLLAGLDDTATVHSISQSAQDVTEQLVDLDVRIRNARQSVARVREFMGRTEKLSDLVVLEGELTRRQIDLERLEAQQRNLSERVALSTVTIDIVPTGSVDDDDPGTIGEAFSAGWDIFVGAMSTTGLALALLTPFLILAALLALVVWFVMRRRRAKAGAARRRPSLAEVTEESG